MQSLKKLLTKLAEKQSTDLKSRRNQKLHEEIQLHMSGLPSENRSVFEHLLDEYLSGRMRERLKALGLNRIVISAGWQDFYRGIDIEGIFGKYYINLQIETDFFSLAFYEYGPEEYEDYPLTSPDQPYDELKRLIEKLS